MQLRKIVKAVRSSPQRRQNWAREIQLINHSGISDDCSAELMLILDVRTRWSSTHQMLRSSSQWLINIFSDVILGRALDYQTTVNSFVLRNEDLHPYKLSESEWESIKMVASWLKAFRSATTQMSSTKIPTLSHVHAIFRGLQDELKDILCALPNSVSPNIKKGLTDAHRKLSDYYYKFDESPFYTWAARTYCRKSVSTDFS